MGGKLDSDLSALRANLIARLGSLSKMPVLNGAGLYIFSLRSGGTLPGVDLGPERIIYAGMTEKSLSVRNHYLHAHSGGSTFRRSLGALLVDELKLAPVRRDSNPKNANKYRFTDGGEKALSDWMEANLLGAQAEINTDIVAREAELISLLQPPLNLNKWINPQKTFISGKRRSCADIVAASFR